jgi:lipopolysaccharide biosynthesis protein/GT2 family glycosyltransferase
VGQGVSVIVLSLNGAALLDRLLSTFFATNTYFSVEFIIIDHGSEDNTAEVIVNQGVKGDIRYVNRGGNFSFSDSCNYGASLAKYPYLLFLNNDIVFTSDVLPLAVSRLDDATIGAVGVRLDDEPSSLPKGKKPGVQHTGIEFVWNEQRGYFQPEQIRHGSLKDYLAVSATEGDFFPAVTGAFLLCRKGDFEKVGGFSLDYDYGLEDIDFCLRLGRDLQKICYCINRVSLQHREGATRQKGNQQQRREVRENNHRLFKASWQEFLSSYKLPTSCERELIAQSSLFDESWYIMKYAQFIGQDVDPINHYLTKGASKGFNPSPLFDAEYYFSQVSSADKTTENPLIHYLTDGWKKYDPNPYFSTSFYLQFYSNELKTLTPLEHYATQMPPYLFYPSPIFSNSSYLNHNPDVASSGLNPLWHYLSSGKQENRSIKEHDDIIPYRIESTCEINSDDDVLIYVAFCPKGKLSDLQVDTINSFVNQGYKVIVVVNSGHYSLCVHPGITKASACITRENFGYDFGAWRLACRIFISLNKAHSITFTNDSIVFLDDFKNSELLRLRINDYTADVAYLTRNTEIKNHLQSYFFTLKSTAIKKGALSLMLNNQYYLLKDQLIWKIEINLWEKFSDLGLKISEIFAHQKSADEIKNPTIHYWKELCDQGFPFLKLQLFTSGLYQIEDPEFMAVLKPYQIELIKKHLSERNQAITYYHDRDLELNSPPQSALPTPAIFGDIGQIQAYNPPSSHIPSVEAPLYGIDNIKLSELSKVPILAVIHCFYVDIAAQILERISTVSSILQLQVVCTTDTSEKSTELSRLLAKYQLDGFVVITQNRGRDVAPLLIEGAKYIKDAKFILHLHTKKSPHHSKLSNWGDFLFDNLIGSKDIILSNLLLLSQGTVGLVYSEHFAEVKDLRNWGFDFNHAKKILQRLGVNLSSEMLLEFPSSTMFWARIEAIQPLFDLNLDYRDFEEESGQIDGTLAHAIERSILYVVEHQGFYGIKVLSKVSEQKSACWKLRADELDYGLSRLRPVRLLGSSGSPSPNAYWECGG